MRAPANCLLAGLLLAALGRPDALVALPQAATADAPAISKVEPPNWWVGLTPGLMVLLSGHGLAATKAACNLPEVIVEETEATAGGDYLFVWLKFDRGLRSGTAVCRVTTPAG